jgi:adenylate cyclase
MERRLAAILAADVAGYARLVRADEEGTIAAFRALKAEVVDPELAAHRGRTVKLMGDGLLVEFASVVDAVRAAAAVQTALARWNAGRPGDRRIDLRIGINLGDVVVDGEDIHGDGVNIAARLEGLAPPGGVCISAAVHEQVRDRSGLAFEDLGPKDLKNIDRPVRVWRWLPEGETGAAAPAGGKGPAVSTAGPSIAVLPFDDMSGEAEQQYFADGITEDIITEISKIAGLLVIARNSSFAYKGRSARISDVCRDLGVRYVLEGSVRKAGGRVRITAQLIDGATGGHLWAERYDRDLIDVFAVQDDVTAKIVRALEINLASAALPIRTETASPEAYDCVLRGREQYRLYSKDANARARLLYERAIQLDPDYAGAHAGLAEVWLHEWFLGSRDGLERAWELAGRAEALDPSLPLVQEALSSVHLFRKRHEDAIAAGRRWIEIEPGNADAYASLAGILCFAGEPERVFALVEKAMRLNPFHPFYYTFYIGLAHFSLRHFDEAVEAIGRSLVRNPDAMPPRLYLAACHAHLGQEAPARAALAELYTLHPTFSIGWVRTFMPFRRPADLDLLIDGLHRAGMAE